MPSNWWIYVIVLVALFAFYFLICFVVYLLMKHAQKKASRALEALVPKERDRFEVILDTRDALENKGRHLPKNMIDDTNAVQELFQKVPVSMKDVKGRDDFLILYYRKYLKEKRLLADPEGKALDQKLASILYENSEDKSSPYYSYNKLAIRYNAYLSMGAFNIFRGKAASAPIL